MNKIINQKYIIRKKFSQNFLIDKTIINNIINTLNPKLNQTIIEIGPGLGALTLPIMSLIKNMIIIEIDRNLANYLAKHPMLINKIIIIPNNVMKVNFNKISKEKNQLIRIFGNLPYNISTSLILYLLNYIDIIIDMNFMLQKEVADRIIAKPNTKEYSRLSIIVQYYCKIIPILTVPPSAFIPTPKVYSVFVKLIPHKKKFYPTCNIKLLSYITMKAFNQRRKIICNSLHGLFTLKDFEELNINFNDRAENISIENYCKLAIKLAKI